MSLVPEISKNSFKLKSLLRKGVKISSRDSFHTTPAISFIINRTSWMPITLEFLLFIMLCNPRIISKISFFEIRDSRFSRAVNFLIYYRLLSYYIVFWIG